MTQIIDTVAGWKKLQAGKSIGGKKIGFVPTMGALHEGHLGLIKQSKKENDLTVVSVFLNPTQFDDPRDLKSYPAILDRDLRLLEKLKVDYLFLPAYEDMYPDGYKYKVTEADVSKVLCGASREGHFDGVLTVVLKLLYLIQPTRAYFGEKDYQQLLLVKGLSKAFFLDTEIISYPTVREEDGLAMSSRNRLLGALNREKATQLHAMLCHPENDEMIKRELERAGFEVEYVETRFGRRFGAVRLGGVRLIDNVQADRPFSA